MPVPAQAPRAGNEPMFIFGHINGGGVRLGPPWLTLPHNRHQRKTQPAHESSADSENTALCRAFYRLARLLKFPVVPVFVFDSSSQASRKRGHGCQAASQQLAGSFRQLVQAFGFYVHQAPAGAEEELATLCRSHLIDIVVTENMSAFIFGATHVIRDAEFLESPDDSDMIRIYPSGGRGGGLHGCGLATALQIIKSTNLGASLLQAAEQMPLLELDQYLGSWRHDLWHELANDPEHRFGHQYITLAQEVGDSFLSVHDVIHLVRPITSLSDGQLGPDTSLWVPRTPDLGRLGHLCKHLFPWATGPGVTREFDRYVWHGTYTRLLITSIVFPGDSEMVERTSAVLTSKGSPHQHVPETSFPTVRLTISTQVFHAATLSQVLNVRELTAFDSETSELPHEKQVLVPSAIVLLALPSIGKHLAHPSLSSNSLLFPILRQVDAGGIDRDSEDDVDMIDYPE
ncbi:hypothetical protein F5887DRAFT_1077646 [Amanita rubescens]|nr:hypothetical protein F5887DRAFT_1077646 [Amanita rubescens]